MQNKKNNYIDVTKDWISNANPNSHEIKELDYWIINNKKYKVDGKKILLDYSKSELECATWLESTFGGEIFMCPRVNIPEGIKTPDFIWNGEYWDLKEIKTGSKRVIDSRLNDKQKDQSNNYILDISNNPLPNIVIVNQIKNIFNSKSRQWLKNVIVVRNRKIIIILKRG